MRGKTKKSSGRALSTSLKANLPLSHYRLVEELGRGGMGVVWKAIDKKLKREVALKFLPDEYRSNPDWLNRLKHEARIVAALNHPNIVTIHSIDEALGLNFIVTEIVHGNTLSETILPGGMSLAQFLQIAIPMTDAVGEAHKHKVIHGDLKSANIMITKDGIVKVLDFGLATYQEVETDEESTIDASTQTHYEHVATGGTYAYMAPEQIKHQPRDSSSDVFSLGIIMYEMATGRRPFAGKTSYEMIASILKDNPEPASEFNSDVPRQLERIISKCLEKEKLKRYSSANEIRAELVALRRQDHVPKYRKSLSIAVLPFLDISPTKDQEYFCDGLAEELIHALIQIKNIRVVSRTSSFQFKDKVLDSREIGDKLGVNTLIEGSISKYGSWIKITATLINVEDGFQLWSQSYNRELKDVFRIQNEIAENIGRALELSITPSERRAIQHVSTNNVQAYEFYLRGRKFFYRYDKEGMEHAQKMFSRAIETDPAYALAYAGIANCLTFLYMNAEKNHEYLKQADISSNKALELDPDLAEAHVSRGIVLSLISSEKKDSNDLEAATNLKKNAEEEFDTAVRLSPNSFDVHYLYARECYVWGEKEKAVEHYERSYELRPEDYQAPLLAGVIYKALGKVEEEKDARWRGIAAAEKHLDIDPSDTRALYLGANALIILGEKEKGLDWADRAGKLKPEEPILLYNLACIYTVADEPDRALDYLEQAVENGFANKRWLEQDSDLNSLRDLPRFKKLLSNI